MSSVCLRRCAFIVGNGEIVRDYWDKARAIILGISPDLDVFRPREVDALALPCAVEKKESCVIAPVRLASFYLREWELLPCQTLSLSFITVKETICSTVIHCSLRTCNALKRVTPYCRWLNSCCSYSRRLISSWRRLRSSRLAGEVERTFAAWAFHPLFGNFS